MQAQWIDQTLARVGSGHIHSAYASTINLIDGQGNLFTLADPQVGAGPRTIVLNKPLSALSALDDQIGQGNQKALWRWEGETLYLAGLSIDVSSAQPFNPSITDAPVLMAQVKAAADLLGEAVPAHIRTHVQAQVDSQAHAQVQLHPQVHHNKVIDVAAVADSQAYQAFEQYLHGQLSPADFVSRVVGLGSGLTPVGDDLVCGVLLSALTPSSFAHPHRDELVRAVHTVLAQTHPVSAAFLKDAIAGKARQSVLALRNSLSAPLEIASPLQAVISLGHTSGQALACGLIHPLLTGRKNDHTNTH